jgi:hypothetical protein
VRVYYRRPALITKLIYVLSGETAAHEASKAADTVSSAVDSATRAAANLARSDRAKSPRMRMGVRGSGDGGRVV